MIIFLGFMFFISLVLASSEKKLTEKSIFGFIALVCLAMMWSITVFN
jgi:hypothetical protein